MRRKSVVLTTEERDILIFGAIQPRGKHLSNSEIALRLGIPVSRVKYLLHQACLKLKAHNRVEAIFFAMIRGEISLKEIYSLDEIAEICSSLSPEKLQMIADVLRQELEHGYLPEDDEQILCTDRRKGTILTKRERDVLILAGRGLTNMEIADKLYMSVSTVRTFLNRACTKLGACKRADAVVLALKQREISVGEITSLNEVVLGLAPLGANSVEEMARMLNRKFGREPVPVGN